MIIMHNLLEAWPAGSAFYISMNDGPQVLYNCAL